MPMVRTMRLRWTAEGLSESADPGWPTPVVWTLKHGGHGGKRAKANRVAAKHTSEVAGNGRRVLGIGLFGCHAVFGEREPH